MNIFEKTAHLPLLKSHLNRLLIFISVSFSALVVALFIVKLRPVNYPVALRYLGPKGVDTIGNWYHLLLIPVGNLFFQFINYFLALRFASGKEQVISKIILGASCIIALSSLMVGWGLLSQL